MNVIDVNGLNCWILNMKPGNKTVDFDKIFEECLFGISFDEGFEEIPLYKEIALNTDLNNIKEEIIEFIDKEKKDKASKKEHCLTSGFRLSVNNFSDVKKNDVIISKIKGHGIFIGKVIKVAYKFDDKTENLPFTWVGKVETWIKIHNDEKMPTEIAGRLSIRNQATIVRISDDCIRQKLLILKLFENTAEQTLGIGEIPEISLNESNFATTLNYMELEDLVAQYIFKLHKKEGYLLLPSSCKANKMDYEFDFVKNDSLPITCQVKNNEEIEVDYCVKNIKDKKFDKIYLFSGMNEYKYQGRKINADFESPNENIIFIKPSHLYDLLKDSEDYLQKKLGVFYQLDSVTKSTDDVKDEAIKIGFIERGNKKRKKKDNFDVDVKNSKIIFWIGAIYLSEFNSLIILNENAKSEIIEKLKEV